MRKLLLIAACAMAAAAASNVLAAEQRPNIVLIVVDDLGYGDVGCYGARDVLTPQLDSLAADGARFTQMRVNPLCGPTRASILTGLYSLETGMWRGPRRRERESASASRELKEDLKLLPQYLKEAGYATGMFGKWHLGYEAPNVPNERGFDEFVGFLGGAHPYEPGRGEPLQRNGRPLRDERHLTDLFTDEAIAFIESHRDEPLCCYVAYNAVHGPLWQEDRPRASGKAEWLARCERRGIDFPHRDYYAVLEHMDHSVGRIRETLHRLGLEEKTLVLFVSDNGALEDMYPGSNGSFRGQKGMVYEGGIRVPAMVAWPGVIPRATTANGPAMAADVFATCLDAAGVAVPRTNGRYALHGVSLRDHLASGGAQPLPDRYLFWDLWGKLAAWHDGWKLVGDIGNHHGRFAQAVPQIRDAQFELYYLPDDPGEQKNLAESHPQVYADLKRRLVTWFEESTR